MIIIDDLNTELEFGKEYNVVDYLKTIMDEDNDEDLIIEECLDNYGFDMYEGHFYDYDLDEPMTLKDMIIGHLESIRHDGTFDEDFIEDLIDKYMNF